MQFEIKTRWDGSPINDHAPISVALSRGADAEHFKVSVKAPFFNNPAAPQSPAGPTDQLWDYEVVEAFFLCLSDNTYLELEFGPHGHYIALLLQGRRNIIKSLIPLEYTVSIDHQSNTWSGEASIPVAYLPPSVNKFNAFAIHGTDPDRCYEALYPQKEPITNPDLLEDFENMDLSLLGIRQSAQYSDLWRESMS